MESRKNLPTNTRTKAPTTTTTTMMKRQRVLCGPSRYRGIQIPLAYWKVAAWADQHGTLAATGYVLDQSAELNDVDLEQALRRAAVEQAVPPLGQFRTFQAPISDIEKLTEFDFGPAALADRFVRRGLAPDGHPRWVRIEHLSDLAL